MKKKVGIIASSVATIAVCASMVAGSTYALFTSEDKVDISVTAGKVEVTATVDENSLALTSMGEVQEGKTWANGGKAGFTDKSTLTLNDVTPGDGATFDIKVTNNSTVNIKYKLSCSVVGELGDVLETTATGAKIGAWSDWTVGSANEKKVTVSVLLPESVGNEYQEKTADISFTVEAVQGNTDISSFDKTVWDGETADVSWYDASESVYTIETPAQFAGFAALVNEGNNFSGKTVQLGTDIDLNNEAWSPIGSNGKFFSGTFDGSEHIISNLTADCENNYVGLFGYIKDGKIKNLTVHNVNVSGVAEVGAVVGDGYTGSVENCHVSGLINVVGNYHVGGLMGYGYAAVNNCSVIGETGSSVVGTYLEANLEGDAVGGLIGYFPEDNKTSVNLVVKGISVFGTRKVGGLIGHIGTYSDKKLENAVVENVTVSTNASAEYIQDNSGKIFVGGIFGEATTGTKITVTGQISNSTVNGVDVNTTGKVAGGTRAANLVIVIDEVVAESVNVSVFVSTQETLKTAVENKNVEKIVLASGTYELDSALLITSNKAIVGESAENTVLVFNNCYGLFIKEDIDSLTLENITVRGVGSLGTEAGAAFALGTFNEPHNVNNLTVNNCVLEGFDYGLYFGNSVEKQASLSVKMSGTTVQNCANKAMYFETLTDSSFVDCKFLDNGHVSETTAETFKAWVCGVDINLKFGDYKNIEFEGCIFDGNAENNGGALMIKARGTGDDTGYSASPATLIGVTVKNCTFSNNNKDIVLGEKDKNNTTPANVALEGNNGEVVNYTTVSYVSD